MTKAKVSVSLDPTKLAQARELLGAQTVSETLAIALDRSIADELDRRHVAGYRGQGPTSADDAWAEMDRDAQELDDDTDWATLYGIQSHP